MIQTEAIVLGQLTIGEEQREFSVGKIGQDDLTGLTVSTTQLR
jgi:hypothetical protein